MNAPLCHPRAEPAPDLIGGGGPGKSRRSWIPACAGMTRNSSLPVNCHCVRGSKARPWVPIVIVVFAGLAVAHVAGLTKPLATIAVQLSGGSRAPGWRFVGDWESDNDPMFRHVRHLAPQEGYTGTDIYIADAGRGMRPVMFKITSEDRSGRRVEMAEYLPESDANYRVRYTIADDGRSLTREYEGRDGRSVSCQYRYVGPPPEGPPRRFQPQ